MADVFILSIEEGAIMADGVFKIFSAKTPLGHYYVQEMPGYFGLGRDFVIMKDRRQLNGRRYESADKAIVDLLKLLLQHYEAPKIQFPRYEPGTLSNSTNTSDDEQQHTFPG